MSNFAKSQIIRWFVLIIVPIIYMNCFWYVGINQSIAKMLIFVLSITLLFRYFKDIFLKKYQRSSFTNFFKWFTIVVLITHLVAYFVWGQSLLLTFRAGAIIFALLYYFVLKELQVTKREVVVIITVFSIIYFFLWMYAVSQAPRVVFGQLDEINDNRGFFRVVGLPGLGFVVLLYFYSLYRAITSDKRWLWVTLSVCLFVLIVLRLTRTIIIAALLVTAVFLFKRKPVLVVLASIALFFGGEKLLMSNDVTSSMIELTQNQNENADKGELAFRNEEYSLCFELFPPHPVTTIFGNGVSHKESEYGKRDEFLKDMYNFHRSDAGYVSLFITYGLLGLIVYFWLLRRIYKIKVDKEFVFFKLFLYTFFLLNFTADYYLQYAIPFVLAVYGIEIGRNNITKRI